jgi:hypothetical protein
MGFNLPLTWRGTELEKRRVSDPFRKKGDVSTTQSIIAPLETNMTKQFDTLFVLIIIIFFFFFFMFSSFSFFLFLLLLILLLLLFLLLLLLLYNYIYWLLNGANPLLTNQWKKHIYDLIFPGASSKKDNKITVSAQTMICSNRLNAIFPMHKFGPPTGQRYSWHKHIAKFFQGRDNQSISFSELI